MTYKITLIAKDSYDLLVNEHGFCYETTEMISNLIEIAHWKEENISLIAKEIELGRDDEISELIAYIQASGELTRTIKKQTQIAFRNFCINEMSFDPDVTDNAESVVFDCKNMSPFGVGGLARNLCKYSMICAKRNGDSVESIKFNLSNDNGSTLELSAPRGVIDDLRLQYDLRSIFEKELNIKKIDKSEY